MDFDDFEGANPAGGQGCAEAAQMGGCFIEPDQYTGEPPVFTESDGHQLSANLTDFMCCASSGQGASAGFDRTELGLIRACVAYLKYSAITRLVYGGKSQ